jgi:hypothetical protein
VHLAPKGEPPTRDGCPTLFMGVADFIPQDVEARTAELHGRAPAVLAAAGAVFTGPGMISCTSENVRPIAAGQRRARRNTGSQLRRVGLGKPCPSGPEAAPHVLPGVRRAPERPGYVVNST